MLQVFEIGIILLLIGWQAWVYSKNRLLIGQVAAMYPASSELSIETASVPIPHFDPTPIIRAQIPFESSDFSNMLFKVDGFWEKSGDIKLLKQIPGTDEWEIFESKIAASWLHSRLKSGLVTVPSIKHRIDFDAIVAGSTTLQFAQILNDTNDYLQANKGAAAAFDTLRDISEREALLLDEEIQAQVATPLYLGLLGTFAGAIIGLLSLLFVSAQTTATATPASSFDDGAIRRFLLGILLAMGGSIVGLGLTLLGNQQLKAARATRDRLKNAYYNFLQKALLPRLNSDMERSMSSLKAVLDTFNQDFFAKIQGDFFSKIAEFTPLVGAITENITVQRDFLAKLQTIGYTQLANATIKVFDRVDESAASFEKFLGYQQALNSAVSKGAETVTTITALLNRLKNVEDSLNLVPGYLQQQDAFIREQVKTMTQHTQLLDLMRDGVHQALTKDAAKMYEVLENRREAVAGEAQAAHAEWKAYIDQLKKDNIYQKIGEYFAPFQQLPAQQQRLNQLQEAQARRSAEALQALQQPLEQNRQIQEQLLRQTERTNAVLEKLAQRNWFQRMIG